MRYGTGVGGFGAGWMVFFGALLLAGLIVLIVVLVRILAGGVRRHGTPSPGPGSAPGAGYVQPAQILAERYARGEIDTDEYRARLRALGGS